MKYMNSYFGQSRIFGRAKMPMNLQFFAEPDAGGAGGGFVDGTSDVDNGGDASDAQTPTVEELLAQLSAERAKSAKLQNEKDTASSEAANYKKQLRQKMTSDEQAEQAKAEAEAAKDARIKELETEFRKMNYSKRFMGVGMDEKTATELAGLTGEIAEPDKFFSALDKFVKSALKKAGEDSIQTLIKNNPSIKAGNGAEDENALGEERAVAAARRNSGANIDILKHYGYGGKN